MIINFSSFNEYFDIKPIFILLVVIFVSYMMISRVPTYAIKQIKISKTIFIFLALGFVLFFSFLFQNTYETLTILGFVYLLSIPVSFIHFSRLKKSMSNRTVIISLSDEKYFQLLLELMNSIKRFEESKEIDICILDAGMNVNQLKVLQQKVQEIKKAKWDINVAEYKVRNKEWLKSQVSRAFLPSYFPNYDNYIWMTLTLG